MVIVISGMFGGRWVSRWATSFLDTEMLNLGFGGISQKERGHKSNRQYGSAELAFKQSFLKNFDDDDSSSS
jgi:hypothetical protein